MAWSEFRGEACRIRVEAWEFRSGGRFPALGSGGRIQYHDGAMNSPIAIVQTVGSKSRTYCLPVGDWMVWANLGGSGVAQRDDLLSARHGFSRELMRRPFLLAAGLLTYYFTHRTAAADLPLLSGWMLGEDPSGFLSAGPEFGGRSAGRFSREAKRALRDRGLPRGGSEFREQRRVQRILRRVLKPLLPGSDRRRRRKLIDRVLGGGFATSLVREPIPSGDPAFWRTSPATAWGDVAARDVTGLIGRIRESARIKDGFVGQLQREKLASLRQLAYGASHEINNPLANISMRAQSLERGETNEARLKSLRTIYQQAMRAHQMISDLMLFANPPAIRREAVDLAELAAGVLAETAARHPDRGFRLTLLRSGEPQLWWVDRVQAAEVIDALVRNGVEALCGPGEITLLVDEKPGHSVSVRVRDTGPGIAPDVQRHMFDPFFSGREAGRGLGFGLSKAWTILQSHGGTLRCLSAEPGQTEFEACFGFHPPEVRQEADGGRGQSAA